MTEYDVVVIGTGTAGQTAAYELNARGLKVAVVEKSDKPTAYLRRRRLHGND